MKINKWWGSLIGLIISIIIGVAIGGYDNYNWVTNLVGLAIIIAGFLIGWYFEPPKEIKPKVEIQPSKFQLDKKKPKNSKKRPKNSL